MQQSFINMKHPQSRPLGLGIIISMFTTKLSGALYFIIALARMLPIALLLIYLVLLQQHLMPLIFFPPLRRYISCLNNLIVLRLVLLLLGVTKIESKNFGYFNKISSFEKKRLKFASGWVGVAPYNNFIDFLYYSCIFNPTYVRMIQYHQDQQQPFKNAHSHIKMLYQLLTFKQSLWAALSRRGFDPVVLKGKREFQKYKTRKLPLKLLIAELHQQLDGPALVFLPKTKQNKQLGLNKSLYESIIENMTHFSRVGVAFYSQISSIGTNDGDKQKNLVQSCNSQIEFILKACSRFRRFTFIIEFFIINVTQANWRSLEEKKLINPVDIFYKRKGIRVQNLEFGACFKNYLSMQEDEDIKKGESEIPIQKAKPRRKKMNRAS